MKQQEYGNHRRVVVLYHIVLPLILLGIAAGAAVDLQGALAAGSPATLDLLILGLVLAMFMLAWYARRFAVRAQDRAIRAEEGLRYLALTGQLFDPRLSIEQITALRFASDDELIGLAKRAVDEKLSNDAIKRAVTAWRPDHDRV